MFCLAITRYLGFFMGFDFSMYQVLVTINLSICSIFLLLLTLLNEMFIDDQFLSGYLICLQSIVVSSFSAH